MKRFGILFFGAMFGLVLAVPGCGDDGEGTGGAGGTTTAATGTGGTTTATGTGGTTTATGTGGSGGGGNPAAPKLGKQIDRFGRPAINTALNHTFDGDMAAKDAAKDKYNQDADPDTWGPSYVAEFQTNLAILDSLDTVCGNQLLADPAKNDPSRYQTPATALADDKLWVRTDGATCTVYLAVEADATGIQKNTDCGGRTLEYDVIDASYSALATGNPAAGVGDGVPADADTKGKMFPYLANPHAAP